MINMELEIKGVIYKECFSEDSLNDLFLGAIERVGISFGGIIKPVEEEITDEKRLNWIMKQFGTSREFIDKHIKSK